MSLQVDNRDKVFEQVVHILSEAEAEYYVETLDDLFGVFVCSEEMSAYTIEQRRDIFLNYKNMKEMFTELEKMN